MAQIPKGRLVKGPYKPICRDRAIYFSTTVNGCKLYYISFSSFVRYMLYMVAHEWNSPYVRKL